MKTIQRVITVFLGLFICVCNAYADDMAAKLNQDWKNINRAGCKSNEPDYYCSGVIAHVFDNDSLLRTSKMDPSWMPNEAGKAKGSVSFSYLRQDIPGNPALYTGSNATAGYIFAPIARLTRPEQFTLLCEYPINGSTDQRANSCDPTCDSVAVNTSDAYLANVSREPKKMCSASPDQAGFTMMLDTKKKLIAEPPPFMVNWNELVIQQWSDKKDKDVPIEAFFYEIINGHPAHNGVVAANKAARLYHRATGITVPVIGVDVDKLQSGSDAPFSNETR